MTNYDELSHVHCLDQETPACGKDAHTRCCLCEKTVTENLTFEEHVNRIFERAHIPEWTNDAKFPIIVLHESLLARRDEEIREEIGKAVHKDGVFAGREEMAEEIREMVEEEKMNLELLNGAKMNGKFKRLDMKESIGWNKALNAILARLPKEPQG